MPPNGGTLEGPSMGRPGAAGSGADDGRPMAGHEAIESGRGAAERRTTGALEGGAWAGTLEGGGRGAAKRRSRLGREAV